MRWHSRRFSLLIAVLLTLGLVTSCSEEKKKSNSRAGASANTSTDGTKGSDKGKEGSASLPAGVTEPAEQEDEEEDDVSFSEAPPPTRGCLQGIIVDGETGNPIEFDGKEEPGIFVRYAGNKFLKAKPVNAEKFPGEYYICDIPLDETYILVAAIDGYLTFDSKVHIQSTTIRSAPAQAPTPTSSEQAGANLTDAIVGDTIHVVKEVPVANGNIRLYKKGKFDRDLKFLVSHNSSMVTAATVFLDPIPTSVIDRAGEDFLMPQSTRIKKLSAKTDENGYATFKADDLVVGLRYAWRVESPETDNLADSLGETTLGVSTLPDGSGLNYEIIVNMGSLNQPLALVSCSTQERQFDTSGGITYTFNQPVKAVDLNNWTAAIDAYTPTDEAQPPVVLVENDATDADSEQVARTPGADGYRLTLKPVYNNDPRQPNANLDRDLRWTFVGVTLRPASQADDRDGVTLASLVAEVPGCSLSQRLNEINP